MSGKRMRSCGRPARNKGSLPCMIQMADLKTQAGNKQRGKENSNKFGCLQVVESEKMAKNAMV